MYAFSLYAVVTSHLIFFPVTWFFFVVVSLVIAMLLFVDAMFY